MEENIKGLPVACNNSTGNNIVKKAEQLIASRYSLTTTEIKIISKLIAMIKISDTSFQEYIFRVLDWKNEQELKRKNIYRAFEEIAHDLMTKPITIRSENGNWLVVNWVSSAEYIKGEGIVKFQINDKLKPYLLELKNHFLQYDIQNILPLKSSYSIRLYELLKDWYSEESRYSITKTVIKVVELLWLRQTFQVPKKYKYANIKQRILDKARKDLKKHTDITFEFEEIKESRKVTHIKFFIRKNQKNIEKEEIKQKNIENSGSLMQLFALLPEKYRIRSAEDLIEKWTNKKGKKFVEAQIKYANRAEPRQYIAYLKTALKNDYAGVEKNVVASELEEEETVKNKYSNKEQEAEKKEKLDREREAELEEQRMEKIYENMNDEQKEQLEIEVSVRLHEKFSNAPATSASFGELSREIMRKKILRERLDAMQIAK